jgi:acetyl-CoA decarbonylase/synthase complex subunit gamma
MVKKSSGFKVTYGPIRSKDLPAFLDAGLKATPEMRLKTFTVWERLELIPMELMGALKPGILAVLIFFLLAVIGRSREGWTIAFNHGLFSVLALLTAILAGAVLTPLLLPWLPGRAFSFKGLSLGFLFAAMGVACYYGGWVTKADGLDVLAWVLLIPALSAYLAMNFTGASTYTSLSGVRKEMRWALPLEIGAGIVGMILWLGSQFIA